MPIWIQCILLGSVIGIAVVTLVNAIRKIPAALAKERFSFAFGCMFLGFGVTMAWRNEFGYAVLAAVSAYAMALLTWHNFTGRNAAEEREAKERETRGEAERLHGKPGSPEHPY